MIMKKYVKFTSFVSSPYPLPRRLVRQHCHDANHPPAYALNHLLTMPNSPNVEFCGYR